MKIKNIFFVIGILFGLFLIGNVSAIKWYQTNFTYDNYSDGVVNVSLWNFSSVGTTSLIEIQNTKIENRLNGTGSIALSPNINFSNIYSLNVVINSSSSYIGGSGSGCTNTYIYLFNNQLLNVRQCNTDGFFLNAQYNNWSFVRNYSQGENWSIYQNNILLTTISLNGSNNLTLQSTSNVAGQAYGSSQIYIINYTLTNNTLNIVPSSNVISTSQIQTINFSAILSTSINQLQNSSLYIDGKYNDTQTLTGIANYSNFTKTLSIGVHTYNFYVCDNDSNCLNSSINTIPVGYIENSQTYNPISSSGINELFKLNISYSQQAFTGIIVQLNYNGTNYSTTASGFGDNLIFSRSIIVPKVSSQTNMTFYWNIQLTNNQGTFYFTSTQHNQTVNVFSIDNCTTNSNILFNYTMVDEETLVPLNGTFQIQINTYSTGTTNLISSYNATLGYITGKQTAICTNNNNITYDMYYQIKQIVNNSYFNNYRTVQKLTITNNTKTQQITLYNLLVADGYAFTVTLLDNLLSRNANLEVDVYKQYVNQGGYNLVQSQVSGSNGILTLNLQQNSQQYNFVITNNGVLVAILNNQIANCQNQIQLQCAAILNLGQSTSAITDFSTYGNISYYYNLNPVSSTLTLNYFSLDNNAHQINMSLIQNNNFANYTICSTSSYGTSGYLFCNLPLTVQNTTFYSELYSDNNYIGQAPFSLNPTLNSSQTYHVEILIEILIFISMVMLMLGHPILIVLGAILGILGGFMLIFFVTATWYTILGDIFVFVMMGILIIWQISRKLQ